ncbi:MAG: molybdenum cofactor guanylyltransferase MobA [Rhizobiaceae bacterium]
MMQILGCILAGGRSRRMGQNKAEVLLNSRSLLQHSIDRLGPQVDKVAINANHDVSAFGLPVIIDDIAGFAGPLAGVLAALEWAAAEPDPFDAVVTVPVDAPFFPVNLVKELSIRERINVVVAQSANQLHPVFALWPVAIADTLRIWLSSESNRSVTRFIHSVPHSIVDFPSVNGLDPFTNINTPEDLAAAATYAQKP